MGLSVFECEPIADQQGTWKARGSAWKKNAEGLGGDSWFLLEGVEIGKGADGEPLLGGFEFKSVLKRVDGEGIFKEIEGVAPPNRDHPNNCQPPSTMEVYEEAQKNMYGGEDENDWADDGDEGEDAEGS